MPSAICANCSKPIAPVWLKCLHCGAEIERSEKDKEAHAERVKETVKQAAIAQVMHHTEQIALSRSDKVINVILFIFAVPMLVPALLWTAISVKRWGRIPASFLLFDAAILLTLTYSFNAHWGATPPLFIQALFPLAIIGCLSTLALWFRRALRGNSDQGMLLGYSGIVVQGLIWGTVFAAGGALALMESENPGFRSYGAFILGLTFLVLAIRSVINES